MMNNTLQVDYAPKAFSFLNATVHDTAMPARFRVDAAKIIVDRAGYVTGAPAADAATRDLQELSIDEL